MGQSKQEGMMHHEIEFWVFCAVSFLGAIAMTYLAFGGWK
jgi:hypothetical protein